MLDEFAQRVELVPQFDLAREGCDLARLVNLNHRFIRLDGGHERSSFIVEFVWQFQCSVRAEQFADVGKGNPGDLAQGSVSGDLCASLLGLAAGLDRLLDTDFY